MIVACISLILMTVSGQPPEADITDCNSYDCNDGHTYFLNGEEINVKCPSEGDGWFSKSFGIVWSDYYMLSVCLDNGFDTIGKVFQAAPKDFDMSYDDVKATTCNIRYSADWKIPEVGTDINSDLEHATFQCLNYPSPVEPVLCCIRTKWQPQCYDNRGAGNNFSRCSINTRGQDCANQCDSNESSDECYDCCVGLKKDEWNCPDPEAPTRTPTKSPSYEGPPPSNTPTRSPTASPVDSSDSTASPTVFDKVTAELLCQEAKNKKDCKKALTKDQGKCKFKSGKKTKAGCKLKSFNAPVDCLSLTKRQCKKAIKKVKCVAADAKGHTCKYKEN